MTDDKNLSAIPDKKSFVATNTGHILSFLLTCIWGWLTIYIVMAFFKLAGVKIETDMTPIVTIWGALFGLESQVFSYYLGSSQGSVDKQKMIERITTPTPTPGVETKIEKTDTIADPNKP